MRGFNYYSSETHRLAGPAILANSVCLTLLTTSARYRCLWRGAKVPFQRDKCATSRQNNKQEVPGADRRRTTPFRDQHLEANGPS